MADRGHTPVVRPLPASGALGPTRAARTVAGPAGRRLAVLLGVVLLLLAGAFAALALRDHAAALEEGWGIADRAAFATAEHAKRGVSAARLLTDRVAETVRRDGPSAFFEGGDGQRHLAALLRQAPPIAAVRVLDPALVEVPPEGVETALGPLRADPRQGTWFMSLDRPVHDGQGRPVAVVQARMTAEDFARLAGRLGLGEGGMAGLFRAADGIPLMRHPLAPADVLPAPPLPLADGSAREGHFQAATQGGQRLLVAWRQVGSGIPVIAVAALPRATALAAWHERLFRNAILFGLAAVLVCALGAAVALALARAARDRAAVDSARREMQAVLEAAADGVFGVDAGWRITFANAQAAALFGRDAALAGMPFWRALSGAIPPSFEAACRQAMTRREAASAEGAWPLIGRHCRIDIQPRDDGGLVVFLRDITAAEEAARRIAESEARLRRVLDSLFVFVGVLAPDGTLMEANRAPLEAVGVTLEQVRGLPFWDCPWWSQDPAAQARIREACARAAAGGALRFDMGLRLRGGRRITLDFQIAPLLDAEGRITHLIPSATDVTGRIAAEEALAASATRLRLAQEAAELGVFERRVRQDLVHWSASMFRLFGADPQGRGAWVTAAEHLALIHPEDREAHRARCKARAADTSLTRYEDEFRIRRADTGEVRWIASRGEILRDANGEPFMVRGVNYDVTERRRAEERQMLLAREVDHRAKNALAVVQSIVALTRDTDPERFRAAVSGRIAALARAHTLLARDGWRSAGLRELAEDELAPYRDGAEGLDRVTLDGPDVALAPGAAQPLAMALHELATNAAKHGALSAPGRVGALSAPGRVGALSAPGGRVSIRWATLADGGLSLRWSETCAEPLSGPPARRGFGHSVIRNTVERQLGGSCTFEWREEGLEVRIALPASQLRWPARGGAEGSGPQLRS